MPRCIAAARIASEPDGPLFRTTGRKTGRAQALWQQDAYRMIQRRAAAAGIKTRIGNHTFRATGNRGEAWLAIVTPDWYDLIFKRL